MPHPGKFLISALCIVLLGACTHLESIQGPPPAFDMAGDLKELQDQYGSATSIKTYYDHGPEDVQRRNAFIVGRLTLYNMQYLEYLRRFSLTRAELSSAFEITKLATDIATTVAGGKQDKTILGAVSALTSGSRVSLEKNFFQEQTSRALVAQMNAQRKSALVPIVEGMQRSAQEYPLSQAITDLYAYYQAGTMEGALQGIQSSASAQEGEADVRLEQLRKSTFKEDASSISLMRWVFPTAISESEAGAPLDENGKPAVAVAANVETLKGKLQARGLGDLPIAVFLNAPELAAMRSKIAAELHLTPAP